MICRGSSGRLSEKIDRKMKHIKCLVWLLVFVALCHQAKAEYDREKFKQIVENDNSNDDAIFLDAKELILRSGFQYEEYEVIAFDGYITKPLRLVNPLANKTQLKRPPILLFHGAHIDQTAYLSASSIQHHPEKYPRTDADGPITSSNRSLGFMLCNYGFDVFLIATRGSNRANLGHTQNALGINTVYNGNNTGKNMTAGETAYEYIRTPFYWQYGQDDVVEHEIKLQIDLVLNITGAKEVSIFSYSLSTTTTIAFLAQNPDYARITRVYIQMGPAIAASHFTNFVRTYFENICPLLPTRGVGFTPTYTLEPATRALVIASSQSVALRYSLIYAVTSSLFGPSPLYLTWLERNMLAHIFMPVSFKTVQQYCQNSVVREFRKFDYGLLLNELIYGQSTPPAYNISYIDVLKHYVLYGELDALASPETAERLIATVKSRSPIGRIVAKLFNHLDLIAGVEVDKEVNFPVRDAFDEYSYIGDDDGTDDGAA